MDVLFQKRYANHKFITVILKSAGLALLALTLTVSAAAQKPHDDDQVIQSRFGGPSHVTLASGGQALVDVVVGHQATSRTRSAAQDLADYLGRITGGEFRLVTGDGSSGIAVGEFRDFPNLGLEEYFNPRNPVRLDEHLVYTHSSGVYLIGASDLAAQHAVWTFLYEIGYRQFFPTETWEVIPDKPDLRVMAGSFESPDYYNRRGPYLAAWSDHDKWEKWNERNKMTSSFNFSSAHAYDGIIRRNQQAFDDNPQYTAGTTSKFRVSEPGLVELVVQDAVKRIKADPDIMSISMEPSDGGGWCDSPEELKIGTVTDRVVYLANAVAEAINDLGYGDKYVGIYAYNQHSAPPNIEVHPNVIVSIATSYKFAGFTVEELIKEWGKRGAMVGIRDYYDTFVWHQGMPRQGSGGNVKSLAKKLPLFHESGARFMTANSVDSWAVNGLGFYLSGRLLWDLSLAGNVDELIEDFLEKSFGEAKEPMRNFYELVGRGNSMPRTNEDLLSRMYTYINDARKLTDEPKVIERLDELALYTRYVELHFEYRSADSDEARQRAAQNTFRHVYRMQSRMMAPLRHLYVYFSRPDVSVEIPASVDPGRLSVGSELIDMDPWKSSELFTEEEIAGFIKSGLEQYEKEQLDFDIVSFSDDLVPAVSGLDLPEVRTGSVGSGFRNLKHMFTWLQAEEPLRLDVTGGTISHFQNRGNVRFHLMSEQDGYNESVDFDDTVPPDGETYQIELISPDNGLHQLIWNDGGDRTYLEWEDGQLMTIRASLDNPFSFQRDIFLYFYVPKGTDVVGGYVTRHGNTEIRDGEGNVVSGWKNEEDNVGYFAIPVQEGHDGKLWSIETSFSVALRLLTVPPYLARNEKELLLPKEVVFGHETTDTDSENKDELPDSFELKQNFPNPFNPSTRIQYDIANQTHVRLDVFNIIGQRVTTLLDEEKNPGRYEVSFDAAALASGVYIYRLQTDTFQKTRQMLLVK